MIIKNKQQLNINLIINRSSIKVINNTIDALFIVI